jgi:hypothetical protein
VKPDKLISLRGGVERFTLFIGGWENLLERGSIMNSWRRNRNALFRICHHKILERSFRSAQLQSANCSWFSLFLSLFFILVLFYFVRARQPLSLQLHHCAIFFSSFFLRRGELQFSCDQHIVDSGVIEKVPVFVL